MEEVILMLAMKKMKTRATMEATSGWVMSLLRSGERCVERVREMPKKVVRTCRRGFAKEGGRSRGSRAA